MPYWYYDKKDLLNTPSLQDGIDTETENRYRKEGARFIIDTGQKMDLGYNTVATGVVYFHRFYMFHSFRTFPRYVTACCCLFLAGKVEETPKKCKDIIKQAKGLLNEVKFGTFGEDPKEEVMTLERILLQTIKFDLQVEHPYGYLLKYAKCLKGDKNKLQKMVQMAWTFVNDSLCTTLSLQWEPEVVAVALMFLAGKLSKFEVMDWNGRNSKHHAWWDMFVEDITTELLEDICHQVLDLYSPQTQPTGAESPPLPPPPSQQPPKNDKMSATPPNSASPIATVVSGKSIISTPLKNGTDVKMDNSMNTTPQHVKSSSTDALMRYSYPASYASSGVTTYGAPPPVHARPPPPPHLFSGPPPGHFPAVSVPPPSYYPPPHPAPLLHSQPVPQARPYYPPPSH